MLAQPIQNVNDGSFACNTGITHKDNNIITIPTGARVGAWWGHVIGGAQGSNDPDNPIAKSHKGPVLVYLSVVFTLYRTISRFPGQRSIMLPAPEPVVSSGSRSTMMDWTALVNGVSTE